MIPETLRTVDVNRIESELGKDVERYCLLARGKGASAAAPVSASDIPVDERVALKCSIPKCFGYNTSANCPPHSMKPDETRKILSRFRMGVVFKLDLSPDLEKYQ